MASVLTDLAASHTKPRPEIRPGFTVRVHERIQEGGKERVQVFEGLVIAVHKGSTPADTTFTVRRIASGIGVEKVFSLHSPKIDKIEVKKVARVRRAKLFFLRGRRGKSARLSERFTNAGEFAVAAAVQPDESSEQAQKEEINDEESGDTSPQTNGDTATQDEKESSKEEVKSDDKKEIKEIKDEAEDKGDDK